MQQKANSNIIYTSDHEMISDIVSRVSNLFYEMMFVVDINSGEIICTPPSSGLASNLQSKELSIDSLQNLIHALKYDTEDQYSTIFHAIKNFYRATSEKDKRSILFIIEMKMTYHNIAHKATYKLTPLYQSSDGELKYMVGAISLSSGTTSKMLQVLNTSDFKRHCFDFKSSKWIKSDIPELSQIENDVLALSAEGLSVPEISEIVCRAQDSVKSIRKRIFEKLGATNITEAIMYTTNYKII